jgi:hypothetical protein
MDPNTKIKFSRDGVEIGEYKLLNVEYQLALGVIKLTDHYWHEGMTEWNSVQKLLDVIKKIKNDEQIAKAKKDEEIARAKKEEQRNNNFKCNCCRGTFPHPEGVSERFIKGGVILFLSGIVFLIGFSAGSSSYSAGAGIVAVLFGFVSMMLFIIGLGFMLSAFVRSPSCPGCGSSNFAKPEKSELSPK